MVPEAVKLTASFKLDGPMPEALFHAYRRLVGELLDYACASRITSFRRLKSKKYHEMRAKHPALPSHYIYTACQMASSIYKSFRKLKRRARANGDKPFFRGNVVMLDDHLFSLDLKSWEASLAIGPGRIRLRLLHGTYHEKFREMKVGQAWLVKRDDGYYLKAVFRKMVELGEPEGRVAIAVDVNENNVTFGSVAKAVRFETKERAVRTAYFLKRRRLQSKPRLNEKPIMAKYGGRERRKVGAIYHAVANEIVKEANSQEASTVVLEKLKHIRRRLKRSKRLNGRLNRWSFRKLQAIIDYKARLAGLNVVYVRARGTSSLCPICGVKLSPNGYRRVRCPGCGLEEDRDIIAVRNLLLRHKIDVPASSVHGEGPPMIGGGKA